MLDVLPTNSPSMQPCEACNTPTPVRILTARGALCGPCYVDPTACKPLAVVPAPKPEVLQLARRKAPSPLERFARWIRGRDF